MNDPASASAIKKPLQDHEEFLRPLIEALERRGDPKNKDEKFIHDLLRWAAISHIYWAFYFQQLALPVQEGIKNHWTRIANLPTAPEILANADYWEDLGCPRDNDVMSFDNLNRMRACTNYRKILVYLYGIDYVDEIEAEIKEDYPSLFPLRVMSTTA